MPTVVSSATDIEYLLVRLIKSSCENSELEVEPATVPSRDIEGFDSLTTLEVLTELEEETGLHAEEDVFLLEAKPRRYRSIRQIATAIWKERQIGG